VSESDPTYADVAEWLTTDVREAIERGTPCRIFGDHFWQHSRAEIHEFGQIAPVRIVEQWFCQCGLVHTTDPGVNQ
jgi:hypothetical protein